MSSQKTPRYGLHKWEPDDDFLREEFNENFQFLEDEIPRLVFGKYTGDGTTERFIDLGFPPRAVFVYTADGAVTSTNGSSYGGLAGPGLPTARYSKYVVKVEGTGFWVRQESDAYIYSNYSGSIRQYCAVR